ncbi:dehydrogenase/reductase SDR family member 4 [Elysia marginata]|uniref:Dehydrogenase/reductase SDR family member 4 n=1 Tax=Elysia marginata TaxID=1093978 RepID=A0AAV4IZ66_9GAST|nr:dehydrogenase/reductase SDR family member 4 [Elysia marginata]
MATNGANTRSSCRFAGKVAIVTGSSSGLGMEVALRLAREGAYVTLTGRDENRLKDAEKLCQNEARAGVGLGVMKKPAAERFVSVVGDVTNSDVRKKIVDETIKVFGRLDILVCNAGVFTSPNGLAETTEEQFDMIMSTNVKANFFMVQLAAEHLEKTQGNIVMVSSTLAIAHWPMATVYSASKAALDNLTSQLALTLAPKGIRVNGISPSYIPTRGVRGLAPSADKIEETAQQQAAFLGPKHPLHGRCATPEEFADAVLFQASDEARYMTGHTMILDAGITLLGAFSNPSG